MKRLLSIALACALACTAFAGCSSNTPASSSAPAPAPASSAAPSESAPASEAPAAPADLGTMKVAFHPNLGGCSDLALAIKKGYFAEEGLTIEPQKFTSGPPEIAAMVSGDIDVGYIGHGAHALAINGQCEIFLTDCIGNSEELIVRADSGIETVADLKGKTIATQFGTSGEVTLNNALEAAGLTREDCNVVNMEMGGAVTAMVSGQVDSICVWAPYPHTVRKELGAENVKTIAATADFIDKSVSMSSWVCTQEFMDGNADKLAAFCRAIMKAQDYRAGHLDEMCEYVSEIADVELETLMACQNEGIWLTSKEVYDAIQNGDLAKWYDIQQDVFLKDGKIDAKVDQSTYIHTNFMTDAYEAIHG